MFQDLQLVVSAAYNRQDGMKIKNINATDYPKVFDSPAKCTNIFGSLNAVPEGAPLPDECLICPKVLQCNLRK